MRFFWSLITLLVSASLFFGVKAESRRRAVQTGGASLTEGQLVRVARVIDGDTLLVTTDAGETAALRLLGIKALDTTPPQDPGARFGRAAMDELTRITHDELLRVALHTTPRDRHGRTLASLFAGEKDVGLALVKNGLALVYAVYPFASMSLYLEQQEAARAQRRGLWSDPGLVDRADALSRQWRRDSP